MSGAAIAKAWGPHEAWPRGEAQALPRWYIVEHEGGRGRKAADKLSERGFPVYLPMISKTEPNGRGRVREVVRPMFPGYFFVLLDLERDPWVRVYSTMYCRGILGTARGPYALEPGAVMAIHAMADQLNTEAPLDENGRPVEIGGFRRGEVVTIAAGPFMGLSGPIEELDDEQRIIVLLRILGSATPTICSLGQIAKGR